MMSVVCKETVDGLASSSMMRDLWHIRQVSINCNGSTAVAHYLEVSFFELLQLLIIHNSFK